MFYDAALLHLAVSIVSTDVYATVDWTADEPESYLHKHVKQLKAWCIERFPEEHPIWKFIVLREPPYPNPTK